MKLKFINKVVLGLVICASVFSLGSIKASAEWVNDYQGNLYYMQNNTKLTGWKIINGKEYYFDENGRMQTGWIKAGDSWYFLDNNGILRTGWVYYGNNWYFADSTGAIQAGALNIAGKIYVFEKNGVMKTSNTVINGQFYTIGADGEAVGYRVPTPDKEFDILGNCIQVLKIDTEKVVDSPDTSIFSQTIKDETDSDDEAAAKEGRIFKLTFRDYDGTEISNKSVKYGKLTDLYAPTKPGYVFDHWDTKSDDSGKNYDDSDRIRIKDDTTLYAQWTKAAQ